MQNSKTKTLIGNYLLKENVGIVLFLFVLIFIFTLLSDSFLKFHNLMNIMRQMSVLGICAFGEAFVVLSGGIDLSIGSVVALSGVSSAILIRDFRFPVYLAFLCGVGIGGLCGYINGIIVSKIKIPPIITTLGTMTIIRGTAFILTEGSSVFGMPDHFRFIGRGYIGFISVPILIMAVVFLILYFLINNFPFGRYVYSIGSNEEAAVVSGIKTLKIKNLVFVISGITAGISGIITASRLDGGQAVAGDGLEMDVLTAVVLGGVSIAGGRGKLSGVLIGALIITILANGLILLNVQHFYQMVIKGFVLLAAVGMDIARKK